jgi:SAM-dependent MidA family methyltransferase
MVERQKRALSDERLSDSIRWSDTLGSGIHGCILSNELLDAMPVHRVRVHEGSLQEIFVTWKGSEFVEELREPSSADIDAYFRRLRLVPGEGCVAEVNLDATRWTRETAVAIEHGFVMTLDYGYEAEDLYAPWRKDGTLLCFYRHNPSTDPYARIGRQDITSHIDLTSVRAAGERTGLRTLGIVSQSQFLMNLGIAEALAPPAENETGIEEYYARRRAGLELIDPGGLGRIRVLVQARGVEDVALRGLEPEVTDA